MLDSAEFLGDAELGAAACPCGYEEFDVAAGFALREDAHEVRWVSIGLRCRNDGLLHPVAASGEGVQVLISVGIVLLLTYLLRGRALLRLAGGQVVVHVVLAGVAACSGHAAVESDSHVLMAVGHVAALVLCRAVLDRLMTVVEAAAARTRAHLSQLARPIEPPRLRLCAAALFISRRAHQPRNRLLLCVAPQRGPPAVPFPALPV